MDFLTISEMVQTEIVEKKSKFIASLVPAESVEEAETLIRETKKKYYDARHNCTAYRVMEGDQIIEKFSDDGEPSGTAGGPMLNILQKNNLGNVVIIVTRYFGGVLLGTGGLVRAYSDCLLKAIEESHFVKKYQGIEMLIEAEYSQFDSFKYYCKKNDISIINTEYGELITCKIELETGQKDILMKNFETKSLILKNLKEIAKKYITKSI